MNRLAGLLFVLFSVLPGNVLAASVGELAKVIRLDEMVRLMEADGILQVETITEEMLGGRGKSLMSEASKRLFDDGPIGPAMLRALETGMSDKQRKVAVDFFSDNPGLEILELELAARRAMADPAVEEAANAAYGAARARNDPRLEVLDRLDEASDLLERNLASAMTVSFKLRQGLVSNHRPPVPDDVLLADVWANEEELRTETENWVFGYMLMAYAPLSDEVLEDYAEFWESPGGIALNAALFDGFDRAHGPIAFELGRTVAQILTGEEL